LNSLLTTVTAPTSAWVKYYRISRIVFHTLIGLTIAAFGWPFLSSTRKNKLAHWWCGGLLKCFNFQLVTKGALPLANTRGTLFVANHISWADIHALNSVIPIRFIAKSEIQSWPVFGYLVRKSGTLFINRASRKDAARIVSLATDALAAGDNCGFFPEGTTTEGTHVLQFKGSVLQAAIDAETMIQPLVIRYPDANNQPNTRVAYAGETTMAESMQSILSMQAPVVELHFLPPIVAKNHTRQALAQLLHAQIAALI
jgi:1-acyl-sn-glycerol-3-phosphate acyltransferase